MKRSIKKKEKKDKEKEIIVKHEKKSKRKWGERKNNEIWRERKGKYKKDGVRIYFVFTKMWCSCLFISYLLFFLKLCQNF